jgi:hypothetical protein
VGTLVPVEEPSTASKAESITIIDQAADKVTVIINYDNIDEGAPTIYEVKLSP